MWLRELSVGIVPVQPLLELFASAQQLQAAPASVVGEDAKIGTGADAREADVQHVEVRERELVAAARGLANSNEPFPLLMSPFELDLTSGISVLLWSLDSPRAWSAHVDSGMSAMVTSTASGRLTITISPGFALAMTIWERITTCWSRLRANSVRDMPGVSAAR